MADEVLSQIEKVASVETNVPPGYQRIVMSTMGKYGAPAVLHIRNFSVEEALELGSIAQEEIPIKVTNLLQRIILEKDVDIKKFYDPEVSELCIHFHEAFYSSSLKDLDYTIDEDDKKWALENMYNNVEGVDYQNWLRALNTGKIKLHYDIDLRSVQYYGIDEDPKKMIKYKNGDFNCVFQYPRFGDTVLLQKAVKEKFRAEDRKFGPLYETYKRKQDAEARLRKGESVAIESIPYLDEDDLQAVRDYELRKTAYVITMMKGLYLQEFMGEDVSDKPLSERVELAKDPRIDFSTYQTVSEHFNKLQIGPVPKIVIKNPVNGLPKEIEHPFRTLDLLAAIKNYRPDNASIEFV